MITRKTLALFGCHEAAVEQFAREAGLLVEEKIKRVRPGDILIHGIEGQVIVVTRAMFRRNHKGEIWPRTYIPVITKEGKMLAANPELMGLGTHAYVDE